MTTSLAATVENTGRPSRSSSTEKRMRGITGRPPSIASRSTCSALSGENGVRNPRLPMFTPMIGITRRVIREAA